MHNMHYTMSTQVTGPFDDVVDATVEALGDEGFGVLADIDVQATFAEKLDEPFRNYRILGACNPPLAFEALGEEIELGTLLPCNVVVYETDDGEVAVSAVNPTEMLNLAENDALDPIASEVGDRFERVLSAVEDEFVSTDA